MSGNSIGHVFTVTTFGESHGPALGGIVDGCPPGLALAARRLQRDVDRRRPGTSRYTTQRRSPTGAHPVRGLRGSHDRHADRRSRSRTTDQRSYDYEKIKDRFRPGHADYTYQQKYGFRDYRGGGRSSARETVIRVAAGAIARKYLSDRLGFASTASWRRWARSGSPCRDLVPRSTAIRSFAPTRRGSRSSRPASTSCGATAIRSAHASRSCATGRAAGSRRARVRPARCRPRHGDDGYQCRQGRRDRRRVRCRRAARLASIATSSRPRGFLSNHAGGTLGGISSGQDIVVSLALKPTSSIVRPGRTIDVDRAAGRDQHDRPPRPLRRDPGRTDRGGHAGPRARGSLSAASGAECRRRIAARPTSRVHAERFERNCAPRPDRSGPDCAT